MVGATDADPVHATAPTQEMAQVSASVVVQESVVESPRESVSGSAVRLAVGGRNVTVTVRVSEVSPPGPLARRVYAVVTPG